MKLYFGSERSYSNIISYQENHDKDRNYIIASPSIIVALINSIKLKHIPLSFVKIKNVFFCIEYNKNAFKKFKKGAYIYEFNENKLYKNDWNYFPKLEYEIHKEVKFNKKIKVKNVYNLLKKLKVIFIKNKEYENFNDSNIPKEKYEENSKFFYHGSSVDIKDGFLILNPNNPSFTVEKIIFKTDLIKSVWIYSLKHKFTKEEKTQYIP